MNKILTMCLLIIVLVVTGCGSSAGNGSDSLNNTPVIYSVTPNGNYSMANNIDTEGNVIVTLRGANFGNRNQGDVVYFGYSDLNSQNFSIRYSLEFANGGNWTENEITVKLYPSTINQGRYGSFVVYANGQQSNATEKYDYSTSVINNNVSDISPKTVYSYSGSQIIEITGKNFGYNKQNLYLSALNGSYNYTIPAYYINTWSDERISFSLPISDMANNISLNTVINIKTSNGADNVNNIIGSFEYKVPRIYNIYSSDSTLSGTVGKTLTIYGENLGVSNNINNNNIAILSTEPYLQGSVKIGETPATIISWTNNSISVKVPYIISVGAKNICVQVGNTLYNTNSSYILSKPVISWISPNSNVPKGQRITVSGSNFGNSSELINLFQNNEGYIEIKDKNTGNISIVSMSDCSVWSDNRIEFSWPIDDSTLFSSAKTFSIRVIVDSNGYLSSDESVEITGK